MFWLIASVLVRTPWLVGWDRVSWKSWKECWRLIGKGDEEGGTCLVQVAA